MVDKYEFDATESRLGLNPNLLRPRFPYKGLVRTPPPTVFMEICWKKCRYFLCYKYWLVPTWNLYYLAIQGWVSGSDIANIVHALQPWQTTWLRHARASLAGRFKIQLRAIRPRFNHQPRVWVRILVSSSLIVLDTFLVAKLLYNLKCPSVRLKRFGGNVIFSAPFQDRRLKFSGIK